MNKKVELKRLENSIPTGAGVNEEREITREVWLEECFPEWHQMLNIQIEETNFKKDEFGLWFLGGPSWAYKSAGGAVFLVDNYSGSSVNSEYHYCGPCRTSGAPYLTWQRTNVHVIDPWKFKNLDIVFSTHHHQDHADIYTIKATLNTTKCKYVGPKNTCVLFRRWGVPENRIIEVKPGDSFKVKDITVKVEENFDSMACMTGEYDPKAPLDFHSNAVSYLFDNGAHSVIFLGDTLYNDGYKAVGDRNKIDVAIMNMGHNPPGLTDKMNPWDAFRVAQNLSAKLAIPNHYENWASSAIDPHFFADIVRANDPRIKTVIMKHGGLFTYPKDQDIGEYRYPDWRERFNWEKSLVYGKQRG
jgi:L-ascorbate 6-phosphate lactonase